MKTPDPLGAGACFRVRTFVLSISLLLAGCGQSISEHPEPVPSGRIVSVASGEIEGMDVHVLKDTKSGREYMVIPHVGFVELQPAPENASRLVEKPR